MNAGDVHYAQLLRDIAEGQRRSEESKVARESGVSDYWYFISEDYCPVCGRSDISRERMYTPKPKLYEDRHRFREYYDWCNG